MLTHTVTTNVQENPNMWSKWSQVWTLTTVCLWTVPSAGKHTDLQFGKSGWWIIQYRAYWFNESCTFGKECRWNGSSGLRGNSWLRCRGGGAAEGESLTLDWLSDWLSAPLLSFLFVFSTLIYWGKYGDCIILVQFWWIWLFFFIFVCAQLLLHSNFRNFSNTVYTILTLTVLFTMYWQVLHKHQLH